MKQSYTTKSITLLLLLFSCFSMAHAIDIDGITYSISSTGAKVDYKSDGTPYSGDIVIPDSIIVNDTTYKVVGLAHAGVFDSCVELTSLTTGINFNPFLGYYFSHNYKLKSITFNYEPYNSRGFISYPRWVNIENFSNCTSLETITFPSLMKKVNMRITFSDFAFQNCSSLKSIINLPTNASYTIGSWAFSGCKTFNPLECIDLSACTFQSTSSYDGIVENSFGLCNITSITIPDNWTTIPCGIFEGCPLTEVIIPSSVTHIEDRAFYSNNYRVPTPTLHEGLISIGNIIFYGIENLNIPSTLEKLGATYYPDEIKSVSVADGNKFFSVTNNALYENISTGVNRDGTPIFSGEKRLRFVIAGNGYTGPNIWQDDESVTAIGDYAFYKIPVTDFDIPNLKAIGDWAFSGSSIEKATVKKEIKYGDGVFSDCINLKEVIIEDGVKSLPASIFSDCKNLSTAPTFPKSLTSLGKGMEFRRCGFTSVRLHSAFDLLYHGTFSRNVTNIECASIIPPTITNFSEDRNRMYMPEITLTVPQGSVELYKQHEIWGQCKEIIGNPNWHGFGAITSPNGLWFAKKGGNICYYNNGYHDTGISAGSHPFQMQIYGNAVYVADAGESHYYSNIGFQSSTGDGQLYKIEQMGNAFAKTTMLIPGDFGCDFADPYTCFIDKSNGDIYTADRNMGIYKFNISDKNWYTEKLNTPAYIETYYEELYFVKHNWLDYYNNGMVYGAHPRGFQRDSNGVNWLLCDYNGEGIFRFRDSDIHTSGNTHPNNRPFGIIFEGSKLSSMYIDETNGYLYVFSRALSSHGLYRIALSNISENEKTDWYDNTNIELIDDSPVSPENNTAEEGVYVRQITGDGKYIYWSYIAEENSGHSSGIKMIPATGTPSVSYLIKDIEVYGFAMNDFDPSGIEEVICDDVQRKLINVAGNCISATEDLTITIYSINGIVETTLNIVAGETVILNTLSRGVHIICAVATDGTIYTRKIIL